MRERLTAAFVLLTLTLLVGAGVVLSYTQEGIWRERESEHLAMEAETLAALLEQRIASGSSIDKDYLADFAADRTRIRLARSGKAPLVVSGAEYDSNSTDGISSTVPAGTGTLTVRRQVPEFSTLWNDRLPTRLILLGMCTVVAGVVGYLIARALSQPFRQLASAAAALGRGRFDLDLPTTGNPEARAIGRALEISGEQLRDRIEREQQFAVHASHVLRTPLTSLRLQLDELLSRGDLPDDARDAASRGLAAVEALETAAAELVALSRNSALVAGAEIPLRDLATALAQRWADALAEHDRSFTAAVEGDIELLFTPGPVETVLDLLLEEVIRHSSGNVRLVLEGDATTLRMEVQCKRRPARGEDPLIDRVRTVVEALGGRFKGRAGEDVSVLLPRR